MTLVIFGVALLLSTMIDSVAIVWDLLGSTVSVLISFAIPFGAYLTLTAPGRLRVKKRSQV